MDIPSRSFHCEVAVTAEQVEMMGVIPIQGEKKYLQDLPSDSVELIYIKEEVGDWAFHFLNDERKYKNSHACDSYEQAVAHLEKKYKEFERNKGTRPVFLTDSIACEWMVENCKIYSEDNLDPIPYLEKIEIKKNVFSQDNHGETSASYEHLALHGFKLGFAFHPDETKLKDQIIKTIQIFG